MGQTIFPVLVEWLLSDLCFGREERPRMLIMSVKAIVPKMTYQVKVTAMGCMMVWDVIGQYTPIHVENVEGVEVPYWLLVWPPVAERGWRFMKVFTIRSRGKGCKMWLRCVINVPIDEGAKGKCHAKESDRNMERITIAVVEGIKEVARRN